MKTGSSLLISLSKIFNQYLEGVAYSSSVEEAHEELLSMHRVLLVLLSSHTERMLECGIEDSSIESNKKAVVQATKLLAKAEIEELCTQPPGEA